MSILLSTIYDIPGWFCYTSVFSLIGIILFIMCVLVLFADRSFASVGWMMAFAFFGMLHVGVTSPEWDNPKINGYSKMSVYRHFPTSTEEYRIERRIHEYIVENQRARNFNASKHFWNLTEEDSKTYPQIFAMHSPKEFLDPDPRVQKITKVSHKFWHPACLFWSPFFASLLLAPIKTFIWIALVGVGGEAINRARGG